MNPDPIEILRIIFGILSALILLLMVWLACSQIRMKTNPSPDPSSVKHYRAFRVLGGHEPAKTPGEVADLFKPESIPPLSEIHEAAGEMMDSITPDTLTVTAHVRYYEVAEWAAELIYKEAVQS